MCDEIKKSGRGERKKIAQGGAAKGAKKVVKGKIEKTLAKQGVREFLNEKGKSGCQEKTH